MTLAACAAGCGSRLTCVRSSGMCELAKLRGPGFVTSREMIPISSIERASVEKIRDDEGTTTGIALFYGGEKHVLNGYSSGLGASESGKQDWADAVNSFLKNPNQDRVEAEEFHSIGFW